MGKLLSPATIVVDPNGRGHVRTIAEAIAALPPNGGQIALVAGYHDVNATLVIPKSVRITGVAYGGPEYSGGNPGAVATIIRDNLAAGALFQISYGGTGAAPQLTLENLHIQTTNVGLHTFLESTTFECPAFLNRVRMLSSTGAVPSYSTLFTLTTVTATDCVFYVGNAATPTIGWFNSSGDRAKYTRCLLGGYGRFNLTRLELEYTSVALADGSSSTVSTLLAVASQLGPATSVTAHSFPSGFFYRLVSCDITLTNFTIASSISTFVGCQLAGASGGMTITFSAGGSVIGCYGANWNVVFSAGPGAVVGCDQVDFAGTRPTYFVTANGASIVTVTGCRGGGSSAAIRNNTSGVVRIASFQNQNPGLPLVSDAGATNRTIFDTRGNLAVAASPTLDQDHSVVSVDASAAARTVNLPAAATFKHRLYTVKKVDSSGNAVTIDPNGAETIDGASTLILSSQWDSVTFLSNGTSWIVVGTGTLPPGVGPTVDFEPMGFPVQDDTYTTFTWDNVNKRLNIAPVGTSFDVWVQGKKFTKTATQQVTIVPAEGIWFFYFDVSGTLVGTQIPWVFSTAAPAVVGYYDNTLGDMIFLADERHGLVMDWTTHQYAHTTIGFRIDPTGFLISGTLVGDGSADVHAQIGLGTGTGYDEDIQVPVTDGALGVRFRMPLTLPAQIPVYYRDGISNWRKKTANTFALLEDGVNRIKYNLNTAGVWSQPNVSVNGQYMAVWICASNNYREPIIAILGQREDTNLANAQQNNTFASLLLSGLPAQELKVLWRVIYQTATTYANVPHARTRDFLDFRGVSSVPAGAPSVAAHNALSGLNVFPAHQALAFDNVLRTVAASTLLDGTYHTVLVDASGGARTITLPAAASNIGREYVIKKIDASANAVSVAAADNVDGLASRSMVVQYQSMTVQSDGTTWWIV